MILVFSLSLPFCSFSILFSVYYSLLVMIVISVFLRQHVRFKVDLRPGCTLSLLYHPVAVCDRTNCMSSINCHVLSILKEVRLLIVL